MTMRSLIARAHPDIESLTCRDWHVGDEDIGARDQLVESGTADRFLDSEACLVPLSMI